MKLYNRLLMEGVFLFWDDDNECDYYLINTYINQLDKKIKIKEEKIDGKTRCYSIDKIGNKTDDNVIELFKSLLNQTNNRIKHIICDQEPAFISKKFKDFCKQHEIELKYYIKNDVKGIIETKESSRGVHGALSILDRLCRTIRNMNYNMGNNEAIPPDIMEYLISEYNNSPHSTISKIMKKPITPNMIDNNSKLEDDFVLHLLKQNLKLKLKKDYNIVGRNVRCLNESSKFDKVKKKLLPGIWKVTNTENGLFVCQQGDYTIKLPRYMLKLI